MIPSKIVVLNRMTLRGEFSGSLDRRDPSIRKSELTRGQSIPFPIFQHREHIIDPRQIIRELLRHSYHFLHFFFITHSSTAFTLKNAGLINRKYCVTIPFSMQPENNIPVGYPFYKERLATPPQGCINKSIYAVFRSHFLCLIHVIRLNIVKK